MGRTEASTAKMDLLADVAAAEGEGLRHDGGPTMAHLVNHDLVFYDAEIDRYVVTERGQGALLIWGDYSEAERVVMMRVVRSDREDVVEVLADSDPSAVERLIRDEMIYVIETEGQFTYKPTPRLCEAWAAHAKLTQSSYYRPAKRRREALDTDEVPAVGASAETAQGGAEGMMIEMLRAAEEKAAKMARVIDDLQTVIQRQQAEIVSQARMLREQAQELEGLQAALSKKQIDRGRWNRGA